VSPTQRSLKLLRDEGWRVAVVEHWNHFAKIRQDLFGIIDLLCVKDGVTMGVQTTSYSNVSARVKKIADSEHIAALREADWVVRVHGWHKKANGRWDVRIVDVS
jgi:hypothetical protein